MPRSAGPDEAFAASTPGFDAGTGFDELVSKVKEICRSSPESKHQWCAWCDSYQGGTKDPSRMDAESLHAFLGAYEGGALPPAPPAVGVPSPLEMRTTGLPAPMTATGMKAGGKWGQEQPDLAEAVKVGQRTSTSFKAAWVGFCQMQGHKAFDPARHTKEFLGNFFEYVGDQALATLPYAPTPAAPPAKRPRAGGEVTTDPVVAALAEKVKQAQRQDPNTWQMWSDYCDAEANGTKDPSRHPLESLQKFLQQCELS